MAFSGCGKLAPVDIARDADMLVVNPLVRLQGAFSGRGVIAAVYIAWVTNAVVKCQFVSFQGTFVGCGDLAAGEVAEMSNAFVCGVLAAEHIAWVMDTVVERFFCVSTQTKLVRCAVIVTTRLCWLGDRLLLLLLVGLRLVALWCRPSKCNRVNIYLERCARLSVPVSICPAGNTSGNRNL